MFFEKISENRLALLTIIFVIILEFSVMLRIAGNPGIERRHVDPVRDNGPSYHDIRGGNLKWGDAILLQHARSEAYLNQAPQDPRNGAVKVRLVSGAVAQSAAYPFYNEMAANASQTPNNCGYPLQPNTTRATNQHLYEGYWFVEKPREGSRFASDSLGHPVCSGDVVRLENIASQGRAGPQSLTFDGTRTYDRAASWFLTICQHDSERPVQLSVHAYQAGYIYLVGQPIAPWDWLLPWFRIYKYGGNIGDPIYVGDNIYFVSCVDNEGDNSAMSEGGFSASRPTAIFLGLSNNNFVITKTTNGNFPGDWSEGNYLWTISGGLEQAFWDRGVMNPNVYPLGANYDRWGNVASIYYFTNYQKYGAINYYYNNPYGITAQTFGDIANRHNSYGVVGPEVWESWAFRSSPNLYKDATQITLSSLDSQNKVQALTLAQLASISPSQILGFDYNRISWLSFDQISALTKNQAAALMINLTSNISTAQIATLTNIPSLFTSARIFSSSDICKIAFSTENLKRIVSAFLPAQLVKLSNISNVIDAATQTTNVNFPLPDGSNIPLYKMLYDPMSKAPVYLINNNLYDKDGKQLPDASYVSTPILDFDPILSQTQLVAIPLAKLSATADGAKIVYVDQQGAIYTQDKVKMPLATYLNFFGYGGDFALAAVSLLPDRTVKYALTSTTTASTATTSAKTTITSDDGKVNISWQILYDADPARKNLVCLLLNGKLYNKATGALMSPTDPVYQPAYQYYASCSAYPLAKYLLDSSGTNYVYLESNESSSRRFYTLAECGNGSSFLGNINNLNVINTTTKVINPSLPTPVISALQSVVTDTTPHVFTISSAPDSNGIMKTTITSEDGKISVSWQTLCDPSSKASVYLISNKLYDQNGQPFAAATYLLTPIPDPADSSKVVQIGLAKLSASSDGAKIVYIDQNGKIYTQEQAKITLAAYLSSLGFRANFIKVVSDSLAASVASSRYNFVSETITDDNSQASASHIYSADKKSIDVIWTNLYDPSNKNLLCLLPGGKLYDKQTDTLIAATAQAYQYFASCTVYPLAKYLLNPNGTSYVYLEANESDKRSFYTVAQCGNFSNFLGNVNNLTAVGSAAKVLNPSLPSNCISILQSLATDTASHVFTISSSTDSNGVTKTTIASEDGKNISWQTLYDPISRAPVYLIKYTLYYQNGLSTYVKTAVPDPADSNKTVQVGLAKLSATADGTKIVYVDQQGNIYTQDQTKVTLGMYLSGLEFWPSFVQAVSGLLAADITSNRYNFVKEIISDGNSQVNATRIYSTDGSVNVILKNLYDPNSKSLVYLLSSGKLYYRLTDTLISPAASTYKYYASCSAYPLAKYLLDSGGTNYVYLESKESSSRRFYTLAECGNGSSFLGNINNLNVINTTTKVINPSLPSQGISALQSLVTDTTPHVFTISSAPDNNGVMKTTVASEDGKISISWQTLYDPSSKTSVYLINNKLYDKDGNLLPATSYTATTIPDATDNSKNIQVSLAKLSSTADGTQIVYVDGFGKIYLQDQIKITLAAYLSSLGVGANFIKVVSDSLAASVASSRYNFVSETITDDNSQASASHIYSADRSVDLVWTNLYDSSNKNLVCLLQNGKLYDKRADTLIVPTAQSYQYYASCSAYPLAKYLLNPNGTSNVYLEANESDKRSFYTVAQFGNVSNFLGNINNLTVVGLVTKVINPSLPSNCISILQSLATDTPLHVFTISSAPDNNSVMKTTVSSEDGKSNISWQTLYDPSSKTPVYLISNKLYDKDGNVLPAASYAATTIPDATDNTKTIQIPLAKLSASADGTRIVHVAQDGKVYLQDQAKITFGMYLGSLGFGANFASAVGSAFSIDNSARYSFSLVTRPNAATTPSTTTIASEDGKINISWQTLYDPSSKAPVYLISNKLYDKDGNVLPAASYAATTIPDATDNTKTIQIPLAKLSASADGTKIVHVAQDGKVYLQDQAKITFGMYLGSLGFGANFASVVGSAFSIDNSARYSFSLVTSPNSATTPSKTTIASEDGKINISWQTLYDSSSKTPVYLISNQFYNSLGEQFKPNNNYTANSAGRSLALTQFSVTNSGGQPYVYVSQEDKNIYPAGQLTNLSINAPAAGTSTTGTSTTGTSTTGTSTAGASTTGTSTTGTSTTGTSTTGTSTAGTSTTGASTAAGNQGQVLSAIFNLQKRQPHTQARQSDDGGLQINKPARQNGQPVYNWKTITDSSIIDAWAKNNFSNYKPEDIIAT